MLDRDAATLWSTGTGQEGGEWVVVDLGAVEPVTLIRWLPGWFQEMPVGLRVETSLDGQSWTPRIDVPVYQGPIYWSASHPIARVRAGRVELRFAPTPARLVRITQTGRDPRFAWTIRELFVYTTTGTPDPPIEQAGAPLVRMLQAAGVRWLYADHGWSNRVARADPAIRVPTSNRYLDAYGYTGPAEEFLPHMRWTRGTGVLLDPGDAEGFTRVADDRGSATPGATLAAWCCSSTRRRRSGPAGRSPCAHSASALRWGPRRGERTGPDSLEHRACPGARRLAAGGSQRAAPAPRRPAPERPLARLAARADRRGLARRHRLAQTRRHRLH